MMNIALDGLGDQGVLYAIRLKANNNLYREIDHLMTRPVGRPSRKPKVFFHAFSYQAASWKSSRQVVAKVEWHQGELFPRIGFIITNMTYSPEAVVHFYNKRGTCEQRIKEGKLTLTWTRLSCSRFASNRVRLALFVLAYNLGNFLRRFALPERGLTLVSIQHPAKAREDRGQDYQSLQDDRIPDGGSGDIRKAVPVDAIENSPPGEGMRESARLELVKDEGMKNDNATCGITVSRHGEITRPGAEITGSVGEHAMECSQPRWKDRNRDRMSALEASYDGYR